MKDGKSHGITLLVVMVACSILFVWGDVFLGKYQVCIYQNWLGVPCPFCGLTRAVYELMHLQFVLAWTFNPLVYLLAIWFFAELLYFFRFKMCSLSKMKILRTAFLAMVILFWLLRCFKYFPLL